MDAEIIAAAVGLIIALGLLVRAFAFLIQATAKNREATAKTRETAAEIQRLRVGMEQSAQTRADDIEERLFARLERETELASKRINELDQLYRDTRRELDETARELTSAKRELEKAETRSQHNRDDLDAANIRISVLEADREKDKQRILELETINTGLTKERDELQKIIAQMKREIGALTNREAELTDKVNTLELNFQRLRTAAALDVRELVEEILEEVDNMKSDEVSDGE